MEDCTKLEYLETKDLEKLDLMREKFIVQHIAKLGPNIERRKTKRYQEALCQMSFDAKIQFAEIIFKDAKRGVKTSGVEFCYEEEYDHEFFLQLQKNIGEEFEKLGYKISYINKGWNYRVAADWSHI